jgi:hypothetical protein
MKLSLKKVTFLAACSALAIAPIVLSANSASALPAGMDSSYLGGGVAVGVTDNGTGDDADLGGNVQARYAIPDAPVSLRAAALISDSTALMPIISYDLPVSNNTNVYLGAGYSFVTDDDSNSLLGNQNAPVVTLGVEGQVARNVVVYGDAKVAFDAFQNDSDAAVSLQLGAGYAF